MVNLNNLYIFSPCPCLSQVGGDGLPEDKCKEIAAWSSARTCQSLLLALNRSAGGHWKEALGTWRFSRLCARCGGWGPFVLNVFLLICHVHCLKLLFVHLPAVDVEPELSSLWRSSFVKDCCTPEPMCKFTAISQHVLAF
jgi:hypothetical protein